MLSLEVILILTVLRKDHRLQRCRIEAIQISRLRAGNMSDVYRTITVERPLRDAKGNVVVGTKGKMKGKPMPDADLRDTENVPLSEDVEVYFEREGAAPRAGCLDRP